MSSWTSSTPKKTCASCMNEFFLHEMPYSVRQELCTTLDEFETWFDLSALMGIPNQDLQFEDLQMHSLAFYENFHVDITTFNDIFSMLEPHLIVKRNTRPDKISAKQKFALVLELQQYKAMELIRSLVDQKYHRLIVCRKLDIKSEERDKCDSKPEMMGINSNKAQNVSDSNNEDLSNSSFAKGKSGSTSNYGTVNEYASAVPKINYSELLEATNNWNDSNVLGKGGFGTVYRGIWKYTEVAIKKIEYRGVDFDEAQKIQIQQSLNELKYLNFCRHDNILPLYGYSINGNEPCLVYQLMTGSLEQLLLPTKQTTLSWKQRLHIARGTARGLQYLHTFAKRPLIHGDIKPANILLDPCMQPKIGDFGLAREGPHSINSSMEVSRVYGTRPYLPIEFLGYRSLSTKVDTYSFGVVILELVTGQRAYDKNRQHKFLTKYISYVCSQNIQIENLMHKYLPIDAEAIDICERLTAVGRICISDKPEHRPEMVTVLQRLEP